MNDPLYYHYYDRIFTAKDYRSEADTVIATARSIAGVLPQRILDVGCGTGGHSLYFAEVCEVIATDIDPSVIAIATEKLKSNDSGRLKFLCSDIADLEEDGFDLVVSLFNVVNYLPSCAALLRFFEGISGRMTPGGTLIFDAWNGLAAIMDPPKVKESVIAAGDELITINTVPTVDLINQSVTVNNDVVVKNGTEVSSFSFCYRQTLWTPRVLKDILAMAGLTVDRITVWMDPETPAGSDTWKIMFIVRKGVC